MDASPARTYTPDLRTVELRLLGTGAGNPTVELGQGVTVVRSPTGIYTVTIADQLGTYAGFDFGLEATTASGLAGYTVVATKTSNQVIVFSVFNGSNAAADLAAAQWLNLTLKFKAVN